MTSAVLPTALLGKLFREHYEDKLMSRSGPGDDLLCGEPLLLHVLDYVDAHLNTCVHDEPFLLLMLDIMDIRPGA